MTLSERLGARKPRWPSLWAVTLLSLIGHLALCQFFSFGDKVPLSLDVDPSNLWKLAYQFPPTGTFQVLNWLGLPYLPQALTPFSLAAALLPAWWFFTAYAPVMATLALLAMTAFLRELELSRPAALFGGLVYAWQGDIVPFVLPGHYAYMDAWPFFALAAWSALRAQRTNCWAYAVMSGASCGLMVGLPSNTDRGAICSLLVAGLWLAPALSAFARKLPVLPHYGTLRQFALCVMIALLIALAPLLALFQSNIVGVKIGGAGGRAETYKLVTQFSLGPWETFTYLVPGLFGWHMNNVDGPYWGWIGETLDYPKGAGSTRNLNLAISTTGTAATLLAVIGAVLLVSDRGMGLGRLSQRQQFYGRILLTIGTVALILSWGWHMPLYKPLFSLPLMDKWRNPLKWLELTTFVAVVLSAYGAQHILSTLSEVTAEVATIRRRIMTFLLLVLAGLLVAVGASYILGGTLSAVLKAETYQESEIVNVLATVHASLLYASLIVVCACLILKGLWQPRRLRALRLTNPWLDRTWQNALRPESLPLTAALAFSVLAVAQLAWVATQFIEPVPLQSLTDSNPLLERLRFEGNTVRVSVTTEDPVLNSLLQNQFAADGISSLDISAASRIPDDLNNFLTTLDDNRSRLWLLSGVKNVAMPQQFVPQLRDIPGVDKNIDRVEGYTLEQTDSPNLPSHALMVLKDYLAKVTIVPGAELFPTEEKLLARLKDPAWEPRANILLLTGVPEVVPPPIGPPAAAAHVTLRTYTPTKMEIDAELTEPGFLLINDHYDQDWQAEVNGRAVSILRADYLLRAIALPAGPSVVSLRYVAHYRLAGLALPVEAMNNLSDGVMLVSWIMAGLVLRRRNDNLPSLDDSASDSR